MTSMGHLRLPRARLNAAECCPETRAGRGYALTVTTVLSKPNPFVQRPIRSVNAPCNGWRGNVSALATACYLGVVAFIETASPPDQALSPVALVFSTCTMSSRETYPSWT